VDNEYRRYTTAELRDMPGTARLEDRKGRVWRRHAFAGVLAYVWDSSTDMIPARELARRKLKRIA
jgi:hypothetical protein